MVTIHQINHSRTKPTKWAVHHAKTQISLGIQSYQNLHCALKSKGLSWLHAYSKGSNQIGQVPRVN